MRRHLPGILIAVLISFFFPSETGVAERWGTLLHASTTARTDSAGHRLAPILLPGDGDSNIASDTLPVPDPFRRVNGPVAVPHVESRTNLGVPPPPRQWKATGRVGERMAVLTHVDGHATLVVGIGTPVDSAVVRGISSLGVELEDRAGRFVLKMP